MPRLRTSLELLSAFDVDHIATEAPLFQTGYPTIQKVEEPIRGYWVYTLGYFYRHFAALGLDIVLEDATHQGRIDRTVQLQDRVYLFEFKVVEIAPEGCALQQTWPLFFLGPSMARVRSRRRP